MAKCVLQQYFDLHDKANWKEDHYLVLKEKANTLISDIPQEDGSGGSLVIRPMDFDLDEKALEDIILSRHSIRSFCSEPVASEKLKKAIELAMHSPSACNRQPTRVYILDHKDFGLIQNWTGGVKTFIDQGFLEDELVEADPEKNISNDYAKINCAIFNFRNDILPFTLIARSSGAIDYFMGLDASPSDPVYTQVWGEIVSTTIKVEKTIESAFGEPAVDISERRQREWIATGAKREPYIFDEETTITAEELSKAIANRNVYLEEVKSRAKEYYESKGNAVVAPKENEPAPNTSVPVGGFNF